MHSLFKKCVRPLLGLDMTSSAVKLLELSQKYPGHYQVENYAIVAFATNAMIEKDIKDVNEVKRAIAAAVQQIKQKNKAVSIAVASSQVISKMIRVDLELTLDEIENQIIVTAGKYIPFPLPEVNLDFHIIGKTEDGQHLNVLVIACRRATIDSRVDILSELGMVVKVVDVESYALDRAANLVLPQLAMPKEDLLIAVVDIGKTMMTLSILLHGHTIYFREEVLEESLLTEEIQQRYSLDAGIQTSWQDDTAPALQAFRESIVSQIKQVLQFFFSVQSSRQIDAIVLAGRTFLLPEMVKIIAEKLNVKTILANPFINMSVAKHVDMTALMHDAPSLMICCGLALWGCTDGLH